MAQELFRTAKLYYGESEKQHVWYYAKDDKGNPDHRHFVITLSSKLYDKGESWYKALQEYAKSQRKI